MRLFVPASVINECAKLAQKGYVKGEEACGLLVGRCHRARIEIDALYASDNVTAEDKARTFEIDPRLHFDFQRKLRGTEQSVLGVWHSHPFGKAEPSDTDCLRSVEPGWIWLISARDGGQWVTNSFYADTSDPHRLNPIKIIR